MHELRGKFHLFILSSRGRCEEIYPFHHSKNKDKVEIPAPEQRFPCALSLIEPSSTTNEPLLHGRSLKLILFMLVEMCAHYVCVGDYMGAGTL